MPMMPQQLGAEPSLPASRRSQCWYDGDRRFFLALAVGTDADHPGLRRFLRSCDVHGVPVRILGLNERWLGGDIANGPGGGQKVNLLKAGLRQLAEQHPDVFPHLTVLFSDSYDVCMLASVPEILEKYRPFDGQIVFSSEVCCWPIIERTPQYPLAPGGSPFRFLNSGGFIGPADGILSLLCSREVHDADDDQLYYTDLLLNPRPGSALPSLTLDYRCELFQTMNHVNPEHLQLTPSERPLNRLFGTRPCVLHANGPEHVARPLESLASRFTVPARAPRRDRCTVEHVIVINLLRRPAKRRAMVERLRGCLQRRPQLTVEYLAAVDGMDLSPSRLAELGCGIDRSWVNPYNNVPLTHGEIGCALSHRTAWTKVREGQWSNVLVLEDDILFSPDFIDQFEAQLNEANEPFEFVHVGRKPLRAPEHRITPRVVYPRYSYWTNGYLLNRAGAGKLLFTDYFHHIIPVDEYIPLMYRSHFNHRLLNHYAQYPPLLALAVDPPLVRPEDETFQSSDTEVSAVFKQE